MGRMLTVEDDLFSAALISSAAVTMFEYFFHRYLKRETYNQTNRRERPFQNRPQYQTEAADELTPVKPDVRSPEKDDE